MQTGLYLSKFEEFFSSSPEMSVRIEEATKLVRTFDRIFFLGNGGSNSIASHMMQDYAKIGRFRTFCFSDPSLITCFTNDYGLERAMAEWLRIHFVKGDLLVAISSSGESKNILNAADAAIEAGGTVMTLSGFEPGNALSKKGKVNFILPVKNYGIVECYHQVILHIILDSIHENK